MSNSEENLQIAFAGESQANRRYLFFADKAEKEGYPQIARLFRAAAEAETVHARNHFNAMDGVSSTKDNLQTGVIGENLEFTKMYPPFINQAAIENNKRAQRTFEYANVVEEIHHGLFQEALKVFDNGQQLKDEPYFVCQICGNTVGSAAPEKCPICGAPASKFTKVE
ncbi:MAG: rubrerythrin family protein [Dehalococcoidales bacterium]|nr:rubrerythrin family protein [Dehalococcoidales bacterium]